MGDHPLSTPLHLPLVPLIPGRYYTQGNFLSFDASLPSCFFNDSLSPVKRHMAAIKLYHVRAIVGGKESTWLGVQSRTQSGLESDQGYPWSNINLQPLQQNTLWKGIQGAWCFEAN